MTDVEFQFHEENGLSAIEERGLPRIAVVSIDDEPLDKKSEKYLRSLGTGVHFFDDLSAVRLDYFDFVVCFGPVQIDDIENKPVIIFDSRPGPWTLLSVRTGSHGPNTNINVTPSGGAHDFDVTIPDGYPSKIRDLSRREFTRKIRKGGEYYVVVTSSSAISIQPFFEERGGEAIAGVIEWGPHNIWYLPPETFFKDQWTKLFIEYWRTRSPDKFELDEVPDQWLTRDQAAVKASLAEHDKEVERTIRRLEGERLVLSEAVDNAMADRESVESRLLWAQDESLASAVKECLETFGFDVTDSDEVAEANGNNKYEDLQIRDPDISEWVALVECKGYSASNGKITDFSQVTRALTRYEMSMQATPNQCWYVINNRFVDPPHLRAEPLDSNMQDLEDYFTKYGFITIPSSSLFQLLKAFQAGEISATEARGKLLASGARFHYRRGE